MNSRFITDRLAHGHWDRGRHLVVPNCCGFGWEADLLVLYPSDWMDEVEIKISKSDYRREFITKADKHTQIVKGKPEVDFQYDSQTRTHKRVEDWSDPKPTVIRRYWFAMPIGLANELFDEIPSYAGLLAVYQNGHVSEMKKAPNLKPARKVTPDERIRLLQSTYHRYWDLRRKIKSEEPECALP